MLNDQLELLLLIIEYLEYNSAHSARTCEMCADRDGQIYKKDDVPLDHPNGNCYMTVYIPEGIEDMIAQYANDEMLDDILDYLQSREFGNKIV